ncbi:hypothetical protein N9B31_09615 [Mariniblastus sp.]|nr:hypothetical protein [Mariniblastus sp.]
MSNPFATASDKAQFEDQTAISPPRPIFIAAAVQLDTAFSFHSASDLLGNTPLGLAQNPRVWQRCHPRITKLDSKTTTQSTQTYISSGKHAENCELKALTQVI